MAVAQDFLPEVTRRLVETFHPDKVILFGSTVWGTPSGDSDLDLLVVIADSQDPPSRRAQQAHRCLRGLRVACDILVRTRDELDRATRARSSLLSRVVREGRVLHG